MSPHDSKPVPQKTEVDLSAILAPPQLTGPAQVTHTPECATLNKQAETAIHSPDIRIGAFGWASINFVVGSCFIAFFCTLFVSENLHFRRRPRLPAEIVYSKPESDSTGEQGFKMELSQSSIGTHLDRTPGTAFNPYETIATPSPLFSSRLPASEGQNSSLSPNLGHFADSGAVNSSSSAGPNNVGQDNVSRSTATKSATASASQRSSAVRSSAIRLTRRSGKQVGPAQTRNLTSRQSLRHSLTGRIGKSAPQTTGSPKPGNLQLHQRATQTQLGPARSQMSMPSMEQGSVMNQNHGTMNPMRMEGGMLAQPGIGGVTGNGLGAGGHQGGHARR